MQNPDLTEKRQNIIKHKNLLSLIEMVKEILTFRDIKIGKINFMAIRLLFFKRCRY